MRYYLGLDNGGTTTKAALYDKEVKEICVASMATEMLVPAPDFIERDMEEMWEANCTVIRSVLEKSGVSPEAVAGLAVCGHGKGLYLEQSRKAGLPAGHFLSASGSACLAEGS